MSTLPVWVQYVQAFSIPALAVVGATIAYRQWRTAHNALRLNLFDRRFEVYVEALSFIGSVLRRGYPEVEDLPRFARARDKAQFLFGEDVVALLKEINEVGTALGAAHSKLETEDGDVRQQTVTEKWKLLMPKFTGFDARLVKVMTPYLGFSAIREQRRGR